MIYIVLGMHKSGTTLISEILHKSGINMGYFDENISYDAGNQYERTESQMLNKAMLKCGDKHSLNVIHPIKQVPGNNLDEEIEKFIRKMNGSCSHWGFKDPRTCLTYPIWQSHLPEHKIIYVYRAPLEVWHHYRKYIPRYKIYKRIIQGYKALRAWHVYNGQLLNPKELHNNKDIFINFSEFINNPTAINELQDFVGIPLADCRNKKMYRSKPVRDIYYNICAALLSRERKPHVEELYARLEEKRYATHRRLKGEYFLI